MEERDLVQWRSKAIRILTWTGERWSGFFLILLLVDVAILFAVPPGKGWAYFGVPVVALTMVLGLYTTRIRRRAFLVAWAAALSAIALGVTSALVDSRGLIGAAFLIITTLIIATPILILRALLRHEYVSVQTILGAICVYVLIGLVFTFVFLGVNDVASQPFLAQGPNDQPATYVYLSFITLATVGYGDYTPAGSLPRALCVLEGVLGQIFLVTTVARLVSLYGTTTPVATDDDDGGGGS